MSPSAPPPFDLSGHVGLFELLLERALHAKYESRPSFPPVYTRWSSA